MTYIYDATLEKCPLPLVKLRVILRKMVAGDNCLLQIVDTGSKKDIPKLLNKQGYLFSLTEKGQVAELNILAKTP